MKLELGVDAWEETPVIEVAELLRRLQRHFPDMMADQSKGDSYVQAGLDHLIGMGAAEVFLQSHRSYFGRTVFVLIEGAAWNGTTASAYLTTIYPPLGDSVVFDVACDDPIAFDLIAKEIEHAIQMSRWE